MNKVITNDCSSSKVVKLNKFKKNNLRTSLFIWIVIGVQIIHFAVFWLYVNIDSVLLSFKNSEKFEEYWTLKNFEWAIESILNPSGELRKAFVTTMKFFLLNVVVFPLGLFYAYAFFKKMRGKRIFLVFFYIPVIVSGVLMSTFYIYMVKPTGPFGLLWKSITNEIAPNFLGEEEYALTFVMIYGLWVSFSGSLLVLGGAFARIPNELIESGKIDGVGWFREMWQLCIPMVWPTVSIILLTMIANIFNTTGDILLLTGGRANTTTINYWMFDQVKLQSSYYRPSAFGMLLTAVAVPLMLITRHFFDKIYADVEF